MVHIMLPTSLAIAGCSCMKPKESVPLQVLLDELVLPDMPIINYNTSFSGDTSHLL